MEKNNKLRAKKEKKKNQRMRRKREKRKKRGVVCLVPQQTIFKHNWETEEPQTC